jgi:hypothetical protein
VDDDEVLEVVANEGGHIMMVLRGCESWSPATLVIGSSSGTNEVCL